MKQILRNSIALLALTGALALTANQALAGGFAIREQSSLGLGMAFAGAAAGYDNDLSAMFFNPATISMHGGKQGQADASLILPFSKAKNGVASNTAATPVTGSANSGNIGVIAGVPSTYATYQISPKVNFGLSVNAPFGMSTKADAGWVGRFHGVESVIQTINVNPVISYKVSPMLAVAGGPMLQYLNVKLTSAIDISNFGTGETGEGFGTTKGDSVGFGFTLGALFQPTPATRIGIGFRSAVKQKIKGKGTATTSAAAPIFIGAALPGFNTKITGTLITPETVSLGLRQQINDKLAFTGAVEWANWSRFKELRINYAAASSVVTEEWKDSWYVALGSEYKWNENTTVRAGVAYEKSPVPDATRTPRVPDNDRVWLTVGSSYKVKDWLDVSLSLAHIFVKKAPVNLTVAGDANNTRRGNLIAMFKNNLNIAAFSAKIRF